MKKVFYHHKGELNATYTYETNDSINQIRKDLKHNLAVLDAIYIVEYEQIILFNNRLTGSDVLRNLN